MVRLIYRRDRIPVCCSLVRVRSLFFDFFFFNDTATTEIYTLSLHDALPISFHDEMVRAVALGADFLVVHPGARGEGSATQRSEEHTSELQSRLHLVCRLLLEKKKKPNHSVTSTSKTSTLTIVQTTDKTQTAA